MGFIRTGCSAPLSIIGTAVEVTTFPLHPNAHPRGYGRCLRSARPRCWAFYFIASFFRRSCQMGAPLPAWRHARFVLYSSLQVSGLPNDLLERYRLLAVIGEGPHGQVRAMLWLWMSAIICCLAASWRMLGSVCCGRYSALVQIKMAIRRSQPHISTESSAAGNCGDPTLKPVMSPSTCLQLA